MEAAVETGPVRLPMTGTSGFCSAIVCPARATASTRPSRTSCFTSRSVTSAVEAYRSLAIFGSQTGVPKSMSLPSTSASTVMQ